MKPKPQIAVILRTYQIKPSVSVMWIVSVRRGSRKRTLEWGYNKDVMEKLAKVWAAFFGVRLTDERTPT